MFVGDFKRGRPERAGGALPLRLALAVPLRRRLPLGGGGAPQPVAAAHPAGERGGGGCRPAPRAAARARPGPLGPPGPLGRADTGGRALAPRLAAHRQGLLRRQVLPQEAVVEPAPAQPPPPPHACTPQLLSLLTLLTISVPTYL